MKAKINISTMLSCGDIGRIAEKLTLSKGAVSAAIRRANPGHPAVREAVRIAQASGAFTTAQVLAQFKRPE